MIWFVVGAVLLPTVVVWLMLGNRRPERRLGGEWTADHVSGITAERRGSHFYSEGKRVRPASTTAPVPVSPPPPMSPQPDLASQVLINNLIYQDLSTLDTSSSCDTGSSGSYDSGSSGSCDTGSSGGFDGGGGSCDGGGGSF